MLTMAIAIGLMTQTVPPLVVRADETTRMECEIVLAVAPAKANINEFLSGDVGKGQSDLDCSEVFRAAGLPEFVTPFVTDTGADGQALYYSRPSIDENNTARVREDAAGPGHFMKASTYILKLQDGKWVKTGEELIAIT
jgi:hypothetical protein